MMTVPVPAMAQDNHAVQVRTGIHEDYARLVFDGRTKSLPYNFTRSSPSVLSLEFPGAERIDIGQAGLADIAVIENIDIRQEQSGLVAEIVIKSGLSVRHFTIGNRVIVDVMAGDTSMRATAPQNIPEKAQEPKKTPVPPPRDARTADIDPAGREEALSSAVANEEDNDDRHETLLEAAMGEEPHVVTLSFTEPVGLAVFERSESLWIVMDRSDVKVRPELAGPNADLFPSFRRYDLRGGIAFRMPLPPSMNFFVYGEGGGLVWRVVLSPELRKVESATPTASFMRNQTVRGGTILWPIKMATKILDVYDPTVGDTLQVITVEQADQRGGTSRSYVDFNSLHSVVGLALVPESDDLSVSITPQGVEVGRPGGLALSRDRDIGLSLMRKGGQYDLSARPDPADGGRMSRIFDFDRWLMGGKKAA